MRLEMQHHNATHQSNATPCGCLLQDTIPQLAYVCTYIGEVYDRETHEHLVRAGFGVGRWLMPLAYDTGL